ncbi:MAG: hypothetical protein ABW078_17390 [Sedimenticola sp.]
MKDHEENIDYSYPDDGQEYTDETYWESYISAARNGDGLSGRYVLSNIAGFLEQNGRLADPLKAYLIEILRTASAAPNEEVADALNIVKPPHRVKGVGKTKYSTECVVWIAQALRERGSDLYGKLPPGLLDDCIKHFEGKYELDRRSLQRWIKEAKRERRMGVYAIWDEIFTFEEPNDTRIQLASATGGLIPKNT